MNTTTKRIRVPVFEYINLIGNKEQYAVNDAGVVFRRFFVCIKDKHRARTSGIPGHWDVWMPTQGIAMPTTAYKTDRFSSVRSGPMDMLAQIRACQR